MKKKINPIIGGIVTLAMVAELFAGSYVSPVSAEDVESGQNESTTIEETQQEGDVEFDWQTDAIIAPQEGKLVGAGYIRIIFDTTLENAKTYDVYFDGVNQNTLVDGTEAVMSFDAEDCEDITTCEIYTVDVKKGHTVYIEATLEDESKVVTETRTFFPSKKGVALGGDMGAKVEMSKLNLSWYYNWDVSAFNDKSDFGVEHVPMVWGGAASNINSIADITDDSNYILGFNEPDIKSQANMSAARSLAVWPYIEATGKRTVSPALAVYGSEYMDKFLISGEEYDANKEKKKYGNYDEEGEELEIEEGFYEAVDVDAVALHSYGGSQTGVLPSTKAIENAIDYLWEKFHKPIWVTEVSVTGSKGAFSDWSYEVPGALEYMKQYVANLIELMDNDPRVERYAWFPYNVISDNEIDGLNGCGTTALFDYDTGLYTELGIMYSQMGNPEGYEPNTISEEEKFVWVEPETTTPEETTTVEETTTENVTPTEIVTDKVQPTTKTQPVTTVKETQAPTTLAATPAKVKLSSVKNNAKKAVTVKWQKAAKAKKYEVQYSTTKKFKKPKSIFTKKLKCVVKKLKAKKKYYFRVRAINGTKKGSWSNVKSTKIKK